MYTTLTENLNPTEDANLIQYIKCQLDEVERVLENPLNPYSVLKFISTCTHQYHRGLVVHDIYAIHCNDGDDAINIPRYFQNSSNPDEVKSVYWRAEFKVREVFVPHLKMYKVNTFEFVGISVRKGKST
jgi:hypothetical protein